MNPTVTQTKQNADGTWQNTLSTGQSIVSANPQSTVAISPIQKTTQETGFSIGGNDPFGNAINVPVQPPKVSTTTISNQNKIDQVPKMVNTVNTMSQGRGLTTDGTTTKYADGTIYNDTYQEPTIPPNSSPIYGTVNGVGNRIIGYNSTNLATGVQTPVYFDSGTSTPSYSPEEQQFNDILSQIRASTDAQTARTIASIQNRFETLRAQQKEINRAQEAGTRTALLTGGVTGKGSSSQYAPISSENIVAAQLNYGVQKLAELDAQEQELISQAQAAGDAQNFKLLEKKLTQVEEKRKEKAQEAAELNKKIAEQNQKSRERLIQASRDNALADLYAQGVTDPTELLKALNATGGNFTLKEVTDTLKNIVPPGLDDLLKTIRQNGATQDVIQKVLSSTNLSEAYKNAGAYAAGGTGIIGEYNFYRAQAEAAGQIPVDFNTYQNMDANRKAKIAGAGAGGVGATKTYSNDLDAFLDNVINIIPSKFGQETFKASMAKARDDSDKIRTAAAVVLKNSPATVKEAFANQAVGMKEIDKAIKLIDEGTKSGALQAGKQYVYNIVGKDYDPRLAAISGHITAAIQPYRSTITGAAWGDQEDAEYASLFGTTKYEPQELRSRLMRVKQIMQEKSVQGLSSQVDPFGTGVNFFETTGDMQKKLIEQGAKDPLQLNIQQNTANSNPLNI